MARLMEQLVVRVCLKPPLQDGFTSILLQTLTNFESQGLNWKKDKGCFFVKFYGEGVKKFTGRASKV